MWTYDALADARRIYQRAGFALADEQPEERFGQRLVGQRWERDLRTAGAGDVVASGTEMVGEALPFTAPHETPSWSPGTPRARGGLSWRRNAPPRALAR